MIKKTINDKELEEHLKSLEEDKLRIFTMANGRLRGALFHGSHFVNQIRPQHNLGILETYILSNPYKIRMSGIEPLLTAYQTVFLPLKDIRITGITRIELISAGSRPTVMTITLYPFISSY